MRVGYIVGVAVLAALTSGCAGPRTAQTISRLQASLDVLDQRLTQLERVSTRDLAQPPAISEPSEAAITPMVAAVQPPGGHAATRAQSSMKPSTREMQQALKNAGFYQGPIDGKMGPMTREAIREFQRVHGLAVDGIAGKKTWAQLAPYQDLSAHGGELVAAETLK